MTINSLKVTPFVISRPWNAAPEKAVAPHSSALAWKIPWTEEPGRLHTVHGVTKSQTPTYLVAAKKCLCRAHEVARFSALVFDKDQRLLTLHPHYPLCVT